MITSKFFRTTVVLTVFLVFGASNISIANAAGVWSPTGSMNLARSNHTTTLLPNGKVLVIGGINNSGAGVLTSAELYDPATGLWTLTGSMNIARVNHTATLLSNGKVLVAGGGDSNDGFITSAELYDPITGTWTLTGAMNVARRGHLATLLPNGKVMVTGGGDISGGVTDSVELYDSASGTWTQADSMNIARYSHTATLLPNGKVMVVGGFNLSGVTASAELYDPATGLWTPTGSMSVARYGYTATLLPNGKVLVAGGLDFNNAFFASAELYDPETGLWTSTDSMNTAHHSHTATLLPSGKVMIVGGADNITVTSAAELYDPASGSWAQTASMNIARYSHTATLLPSGKVMVVGGQSTDLASAELYDPGDIVTPPPPPPTTLTDKAIAAAKAVVGEDYLSAGKGWDWHQKKYLDATTLKLKTPYFYDAQHQTVLGSGLDCSGLVMWAYNSSFNPFVFSSIVPAGETAQPDIAYEGTSGQYYFNTNPVPLGSQQPGDIMFFDFDGGVVGGTGPLHGAPLMSHEALYVGDQGSYDVVQAHSPALGVITSLSSVLSAEHANPGAYPGPGFMGFRRIKPAQIAFAAKTHSPIDLIVTNPNSATITRNTVSTTSEEILHEIPGELYYSVYDTEADGSPLTAVYSPYLENGIYTIKPVKRSDAPAGSTYSLTVDTALGPVTLAQNVPVDQIPPNGYGLKVVITSSSTNATTTGFLVTDTTAPNTLANVVGPSGANGWYLGSTTVALLAFDNPDGVGVDKTYYSLDGAAQTIYTGAIPVGGGGTHMLSYYTVDLFGNTETLRTIQIKIDQNAPEAKVSASTSTQDLQVEGVDTQSTTTVSKDTTGNYTVTDAAGHTTKLIFSKTFTGKFLTYAKLTGIKYDSAATTTISTSNLLYLWDAKKTPPVLMSQTIAVNDTYLIAALYDPTKNKTTVITLKKNVPISTQIINGLEIIRLTTTKGVIGHQI